MWRNWMNYFFPKKVEQSEPGSESTPTDKLDNLEKQIDNDSPPSSPIHVKEPEPYQVIEDRIEESVHVSPAELESIVQENPVELPTTWDPNEFTDSDREQVVEPEPESKPVVEPEPEPEPVVEPEPEPVVESEPEPVVESEQEPKPVVEPEPASVVEPESEPESAVDSEPKVEVEDVQPELVSDPVMEM